MEVGGDGTQGQLQIHFSTKQKQYAVADTPYSVPAQVSVSDLNTLVNSILSETVPEHISVEFDFLVAGEFLRVILGNHLQDRHVSFEDLIEIEYVERFPPPEPQDCLLHDDWVSALETRQSWILTGSYDNTLNIWTTKGVHKLTIPGHTSPIKAVTWVSLNEKTGVFASASQDQTAIIWEWDIANNSVECVNVCKGHERGIDCIAVSPNGQRLATGSWDTMMKIWSAVSDDNSSSSKEAKKTKTEQGTTRTPLVTLPGHKEAVSGVQWLDNESVLSCSWDHTIKIWDLSLEGLKSEITGNKSFFDVSFSPLNGLIISCSADKNIRMYDPRSSQGTIVKQTYLGHNQWVQAVQWSKTSEHLFISGAYDMQVKLWDSRSSKAPLFDLTGHDDKVMDCDWSNPEFIVSGGADNSVRIFKTKKLN